MNTILTLHLIGFGVLIPIFWFVFGIIIIQELELKPTWKTLISNLILTGPIGWLLYSIGSVLIWIANRKLNNSDE